MPTFDATSNAFIINAYLLTYDTTSNAFMIDVCLPTSFQHAMSKTFDIPSNTRPLSNIQLLLALTKKLDLLMFTKKKTPTSLDTHKTSFLATTMAFLRSQNHLSHFKLTHNSLLPFSDSRHKEFLTFGYLPWSSLLSNVAHKKKPKKMG